MTHPFGGQLLNALPELRAMAESRMLDTCIVEYKTGNKTRDPETRTEVDEYATRFTCRCRIKDMGFADGDQQVGGRREVTGATQVHLPWDVEQVYTDDRITITAVGSMTPARYLGRVFYVGSDHDRSQATATRLNVKEAP